MLLALGGVFVMRSPREGSRQVRLPRTDQPSAAPHAELERPVASQSVSRTNVTKLGYHTRPEILRDLLSRGTREQRVAALTWMVAQDRQNGTTQFENDVLELVNDTDFLVAMKATESALFYGNKVHALVPRDRSLRALEYYLSHGDFEIAPSASDSESYFIPILGTALTLARNARDPTVASDLEQFYRQVKAQDEQVSLEIGLVLAERQRFVALDAALEGVASKSKDIAWLSAQIVSLAKIPQAVPHLRRAYLLQEKGQAREAIISALSRVNHPDAKPVLLELLLLEKQAMLRRDIVQALLQGGMGREEIATQILPQAFGDNEVNMSAASVLVEIGDRRILPHLRRELEAMRQREVDNPERLRAILSLLGNARDKDAVASLGPLLMELQDDSLRSAVRESLEEIGGQEARAWLDWK
ncbi:MAG TPA: hypothetical protein VNO22_01680 [Planctomycetota bacterium]|nr:hypothetical protein [Planctomycetota bacterium]